MTKVEFLKKLKQIVGDNGLVAISVLDLTEQMYIDDYKKEGINYCDRRCIAEKYLI